MNEGKLIKKAKKGNHQAFERLLEQYSDQLYKTAYIYVRNREDALDVVQETAYKAFVALKQLKQEEYFATWLTKILIRSAYEVLEKQKKEVILEVIDGQAVSNNSEEKLLLMNALEQLQDHYRTAIILFYYRDLPIRDIAMTMDIPENTVKTYLRRGKRALKILLEGTEYDEQGNISSNV